MHDVCLIAYCTWYSGKPVCNTKVCNSNTIAKAYDRAIPSTQNVPPAVPIHALCPLRPDCVLPTFQVTFTTLALASVSSSSTADVEGTRTDLKVVKTVK